MRTTEFRHVDQMVCISLFIAPLVGDPLCTLRGAPAARRSPVVDVGKRNDGQLGSVPSGDESFMSSSGP
ncbi:Hypothetical protein SMAX5B_022089 [Scophthalmus maximus]|uniref:Uncharacterized protein n=1 Tax=Scophthalmus maximus TaxID=52904 RepID=A0A2U9BX18_SCOMX|nr:Hypothetical protein SMAX5B_022089 [Scophthalmus maximus]